MSTMNEALKAALWGDVLKEHHLGVFKLVVQVVAIDGDHVTLEAALHDKETGKLQLQLARAGLVVGQRLHLTHLDAPFKVTLA